MQSCNRCSSPTHAIVAPQSLVMPALRSQPEVALAPHQLERETETVTATRVTRLLVQSLLTTTAVLPSLLIMPVHTIQGSPPGLVQTCNRYPPRCTPLQQTTIFTHHRRSTAKRTAIFTHHNRRYNRTTPPRPGPYPNNHRPRASFRTRSG